jgi:hypothetical protein
MKRFVQILPGELSQSLVLRNRFALNLPVCYGGAGKGFFSGVCFARYRLLCAFPPHKDGCNLPSCAPHGSLLLPSRPPQRRHTPPFLRRQRRSRSRNLRLGPNVPEHLPGRAYCRRAFPLQEWTGHLERHANKRSVRCETLRLTDVVILRQVHPLLLLICLRHIIFHRMGVADRAIRHGQGLPPCPAQPCS